MVEYTAEYRSDSEDSRSLHSAMDFNNEPPAWMQAYMQTQQKLVQDLVEAQARERQDTARQIADLTMQLNSLRTDVNNTINTPVSGQTNIPEIVMSTSGTIATEPARRPRPILPDPEPFDAEDLSLYPQFRAKLEAKLTVDAAAIGKDREQLWYGFSRLQGKAAARILPWMTTYKEDATKFILREFWKQIDSAFQDAAVRQKAIAKLNLLRQGNQSFDDLLRELDQCLLEAGGHNWEDEVKKGYLNRALNSRLRERLIAVEEATEYEAYCQQVKKIADRLEEYRRSKKQWSGFQQQGAGTAWKKASQGDSTMTEDRMDWEPSVFAANKSKAPRMSEKERERRKTAKLCYRCGSSEHYIAGCLRRSSRRSPSPQRERTPRKSISKIDSKVEAVKKVISESELETSDDEPSKE